LTGPDEEVVLHASSVAWEGRAALILGPSGAGKSALALHLMAFGAVLVADDRVRIWRRDAALFAGAPTGLPALIEARGVGLVPATLCPSARLALAVDLSQAETVRLPPLREYGCLGLHIPLVHGCMSAHFPAAILQYLKAGTDIRA
jgi:HPr kinase/phosphorylase